MIFANVKNGKGEFTIGGDAAELSADMIIIIRGIYRQMRMQNAEAARIFKSQQLAFWAGYPELAFPED